jgi:cytochrome c553
MRDRQGFLVALVPLALLVLMGGASANAPDGEAIYARHCASCHGDDGQGVDDEYDEPLWGNRSPASLARYIHKSMPEDEEDAVVDADATAVAQYVYDAFYSPAAQARNRPPRVELTRLTNTQYRNSVADLVGSFGRVATIGAERGLKGRYFNSEKMAKEKKFILERVDPKIDFDFGTAAPVEKMTQKAFSIRWTGSLIAPHSGTYDFRIRTHNGAMFHLNHFGRSSSENAFIDAYVSTGNELQDKSRKVYLLGGRAYPLHLQYFSYQEKVSTIRLEWKPPHGVWEPVPEEALSPQVVPPVTVVQTAFSADDHSLGYERGSSVSKEWQQSTTHAAIDIVNHVVTNLESIARLNERDRKDPQKLKAFCHQFAERAFRRPLSADQKRIFVEARFANQSDPEAAMKQSLLLVLTSPRFLYPGLADSEGVPDGETVASRLALALWDSLPDESLREAAREGKLRTPRQVSDQARRMLRDPRSRHKVRGFFQHWLAMDERADLGKDQGSYPGFDKRVVADLRRSLERFVDEIVWSGNSDFRQLLVADYLYLNPRLAEYYEADGPREGGFAKAAPPDGKRAGIFTHPYLLAANAYHDNTSPIHRGVFLSRNVLGRLLKPPPEAIVFKSDDFDPTLTMREKVTQLTKRESCMNCHRVINPIGFSLENFDAVGRFRTVDNNKPVNTVSDYVNAEDEKVRVTGAKDLADLAVGSEAAHRAFITHLFHHLVKQSADAYGPETLDELRREFVASQFHIQNLLVEITTRTALHGAADRKQTAAKAPH